MPKRTRQLVAPQGSFERARFIERNWLEMLKRHPLSREGWDAVGYMEDRLFPRPIGLDPRCPQCGVETEEGTVERRGDSFEVRYGCGHTLVMSQLELQQRMQHDSHA